jgi:molybdate transport system regulatory protein
MKKKKTEVAGRLWVEIDGENFLGSGRVELLEKIEMHGSLRKAAISMGLSYRKAYYAVRSMNDLAPDPLVELHQGGKGGGCAKLTSSGRKYVLRYREISQEFVIFLTRQSDVF